MDTLKKTILFDYQAFEMQPFGGVSRSYAELIAHLRKTGADCRIGLKESDNVYIQDEGVHPLHYTHDRFLAGKKYFRGQRRLIRMAMRALGRRNECLDINRDYCIKLLKRQHFDIFEPTFFDSYFLPYLKGKPFVLTVHDMIPELLGMDAPQAQQKKLLCPLAAHIHVPSENTKKDLVNILNIKPEMVTVTPHGAPVPPATHHPSPYPFPYLLFVGTREGYKNFIPFVDECAIIIARHPELHVVCTGSPFAEAEKRMLAGMGLLQHFIHKYASELEMQTLYQNAVAFVYPSAYEGFGLPILEAFVCGCPVLLNNASCFPEVGGDAALYFDINQHGDLAEHIINILQSSSEDRTAIIVKGREQAKSFCWETTAQKLKQVYELV